MARTDRQPPGNGAMYFKRAVNLAAFFASYGVLVFVAANWWRTAVAAPPEPADRRLTPAFFS